MRICTSSSFGLGYEGNEGCGTRYRKEAVAWMKEHPWDFAGFVSSSDEKQWKRYLRTMSESGIWGGEPELTALSQRFEVRIVIYRLEEEDPTVIGAQFEGPAVELAFSRFGNFEHYDCVRIKS